MKRIYFTHLTQKFIIRRQRSFSPAPPRRKRQGYSYEAAFGGSVCEAGFVRVARGFYPRAGNAARSSALRKVSYFIFLSAIFLASCVTGTAVPIVKATTATPTQMPPPDFSPTPRFTPTEEVTETPQATPTETPVPVPDVKLSDLRTFTFESFTPISHEARLQLNRDIANGVGSQLPADISNVRPVTFAVANNPDGIAVVVSTYLGQNCVLRYAVNDGGVQILVWEIVARGQDKQNHKVAFSTAPLPMNDEETYIGYALDLLHGLGAKQMFINFNLVLAQTGQQLSPNVQQLLIPSPEGENLHKRIIDEKTGDTPFWLPSAFGA